MADPPGAQLLVPLGLLLWIAFGQDRSRAGWFSKASLIATYLAVAAIAGLWPVNPWYVIAIYLVLFVLVIAHSMPRMRSRMNRPGTGRGWLGVGL
jgi:hypothetical protein